MKLQNHSPEKLGFLRNDLVENSERYVNSNFLKTNDQKFVARAYQRVMEIYKRMPNQKTVVVQSVSNYCYQYRNVADILELDEHLNSNYKMFDITPQVNTIADI